MLVLQNQMNCTVDQNWVELNRNWLLAAAMEAAEAIGHHGWKWWKKQTPDTEQLQMELIDIWHFALSTLIEENPNDIDGISISVEHIITGHRTGAIGFNNSIYHLDDMSILRKLQLLMAMCSDNMFHIPLFMSICEEAGLSQESLYKQYIGKNILNIFRQQNGYKDGSYIKIWDGEEDNIHLVKIIDTLDVNDECFADNLMDALVETYARLN